MNPLEQWLADVVSALAIDAAWSPEDRDLVLDLARDVAHGVARPAAPLTTYLAGIAVGAGGTPRDVAERLRVLADGWADQPTADQPTADQPTADQRDHGVWPRDTPYGRGQTP